MSHSAPTTSCPLPPPPPPTSWLSLTPQLGQWTPSLVHGRVFWPTPFLCCRRCSRKPGKSKPTHPDCPQGASSTLVPRVGVSLPCTSSQAPPSPQGPSSAQVRIRSRQSRPSRPSCLAAVRHLLSPLGALQGVEDKVSQAHRSGTQGVYSSHWSRWLHWSQDNQVHPCNPSRFPVGNFLAFLSTHLSVSVSFTKESVLFNPSGP